MWKETARFIGTWKGREIKSKKDLKQDCQYLDKDLNRRHPGYEAGFLLTRHDDGYLKYYLQKPSKSA
jgi:hypothetical protein